MKKLTVGVVLGACFLVGTPVYAVAVPQDLVFTPYVYLGGQLGWTHADWPNSISDNNGAAYGAKLGYQASRRFGTEFGGFALPGSNSNTPDSWISYGAATFRLPLGTEAFFLRGKAGLAYREVNNNNSESGVNSGNYLTGIFGASLNYAFSTEIPVIVGLEYSNILSSSDAIGNNSINAPSAQILAATLSVAFQV